MPKKILLLFAIIFLFIGWSNNPVVNTPVCTADHDQNKPQMVSDGSGGAVIVWEDSRSGSDPDIYGQSIDSSGTAAWTPGGAAICTAVGPQRFPRVTADSAGGFIITWYDWRNGKNYDIYAQRVDSSGKVQWSVNGIAICTADQDQYDPVPVSDGSGGVFIVWQDRRNGGDYDIYAQRIDSSGRIKWDANGIPVCAEKEDQDNPRLVSDGRGGAIITWQDRRNGNNYDIYAQRIDASGKDQWTARGIEICGAEEDQKEPQMISDDMGGAIIVWVDKRNRSDYDIYTQRINAAGAIQWTVNGMAICAAANNQYDPQLVSDGNGGAFITWQDYRKGSDCNFDAFAQQTDLKGEICQEKQLHDWNVYAQLINASGRIQWAANGVGICTADVDQYKPQMAADGLGGTIIIWRATDKENDHNIYAQRLTGGGTVKWLAAGVVVSMAPGVQYDPLLVPDGKGGAVAAWNDKRKGNNCDIYAQKICASGEIGGCSVPVAVIDADTLNGPADLTIKFNSKGSYDPDGTITQWRWNLGDGKRATTENVTHTYSNPGTYSVTLQVRDNNGKWSPITTKQVNVLSPKM